MDISALNPSMTQFTGTQSLLSMLGTTNTSTTSTDPMQAILQGEQQLMTLSAVGHAASQAEGLAHSTGDSNVVAGMQQAISTLFTSSNTADAYTVLHTANSLATSDPDSFKAVFTTVNTLAQKGMTSSIMPYLTAANAAFAQNGASGITDLNTAVTNALTNNSDSSSTLQALTSVFQQYTGSSTTNAVSQTATPAKTEILADDSAYFSAVGS